MELRQLEYFMTIADEGTFAAAARKLHMTQPPLSYQMRTLEEELGTALFVRGARRSTLTDAGKLLYARAESMLRLKKRTEEEMKDIISGERGEIRLGIVSSAEDFFVRQYLAPYLRARRGVHVRITDADTDRMMELLRADLLDAAVVRTPFDDRELDVTLLKRQRLCAVYSRAFRKDRAALCGHGGSGGAACGFPDLRGLPLITYRRWQARIEEAFARTGSVPAFTVVAGDGRTCVSLAAQGLGCAILPVSCVPPDAEDLICADLTDPEVRTDICAVSRRGAYVGAAARGLLAFLRETEDAEQNTEK